MFIFMFIFKFSNVNYRCKCIFLLRNRKCFWYNEKKNEIFSKYSLYTCMSAKLFISNGLVPQLSSTVKLIQDCLAEKRSFCHSCQLFRILVRHITSLKVSTIADPPYWATCKVDSFGFPWLRHKKVTKHPLSFSSTSIIFPTCHSLLYHTATYLWHSTFRERIYIVE